jgi:hypothetical protein
MNILSRFFQLKESPVDAEMRAHQAYVNEIRRKLTDPQQPPGPPPTGGPAFARAGMHSIEHCYLDQGAEGMTLRDYIAVAAMHGLIAKNSPASNDFPLVTAVAWRIADMMMQGREQP